MNINNHINLLSDSSDSEVDIVDVVSRRKTTMEELDSKFSNVNLNDNNKVSKQRFIQYGMRSNKFLNTDDDDDSSSCCLDDSASSEDNDSSKSSISSDDDDSSVLNRNRLLSKAKLSKSNNRTFYLDDTSEEEGEEEKEDEVTDDNQDSYDNESNEEIISIVDSFSSLNSSDEEQEEQNKTRRHSYNIRKEEINLSDSQNESITSTCDSVSSSSSSQWLKTKWNGSYYYTLPKSLAKSPLNSSNTNQETQIEQRKYPDFYIPESLYHKMYEHQKDGVEFLASLHNKGIGGILGDDMGLGKTLQTLSLLGGLMLSKTMRRALVICPKSLLLNWEREARSVLIEHCALRVNIVVLDSNISQEKRERILNRALECSSSRPFLVITTYGLVKTSALQFLRGGRDEKYYWDYCILDEGHQIKNPNTQQHKSCERVSLSKHTRRLLLTGTPIQNNMKELWALFHWATKGRLLGPLKRFENQFGNPIKEGRNKNASEWTLRTAERANNRLQAILKPHFLQRLKDSTLSESLPEKEELVVWTHLSDRQRDLYEKYIVDGGKVAAVLSGEARSPLEAITYLKKLCDHPSLVTHQKSSVDNAISESGKLDTLVHLVNHLQQDGHRCLIFSPSTRMLDIIESVMSIKLARIDGNTKGKDRQAIVDKFNARHSNIDAMILSTKAAGCGLNLIGADRAIIYSPSWNPADDAQAVDRCYRIGQKNDVIVYRFITCGTVEERMYERQVHKDGIRRTVTTKSGCATERYFDEKDLRKMFTLKERGQCDMLMKMKRVNAPLDGFSQVVGVTSHDSVYYNTVVNIDCPPVENPFAKTPVCDAKKPVSYLTTSPSEASGLILKIANLNLTSDQINEKKDKDDNNHKSNSNKERSETMNQPRNNKDISSLLEKVDELTSEGKIEESLLILLQLLDRKELGGKEKLGLHKKISARAILYLEWHNNRDHGGIQN